MAFIFDVKNFLGNKKTENYDELIGTILNNFKELSCNMSIKVTYTAI